MKKLTAILTNDKIDTVMFWIMGAFIIVPAVAVAVKCLM